MGETTPRETRAEQPWRLPRRDYVLLPLISAATVLLLLVGGEVAARLAYVQDDAVEPCEYGEPGSFRYKPLCTSHTKVWEGPWVTQHFNDCGYRSAESCAARPAGSLRVVVVGSSTARGALVNYPDSFAARASAWLSDRCGGAVDFQNLGSEPTDVDTTDRRMPEALALRPAAVVMTIGPYDLMHLKDRPAGLATERPPGRFNLRNLVTTLRESRLFLVMQSYLYRDLAFQIRTFLLNGDSADSVRTPLSPAWRHRIAGLGDLLDRMTAFTSRQHVPVLLFYVPERAQAALATRRSDSPGTDPLALGAALAEAAGQRGVQFFDATAAFASAPDFQSLYYLTDGHPRPGGHAALAGVIEHALLAEPGFARCTRPSPGS